MAERMGGLYQVRKLNDLAKNFKDLSRLSLSVCNLVCNLSFSKQTFAKDFDFSCSGFW